MKTKIAWLAVALIVALASPVLAGDYKCTMSTQECLNAMAAKLKTKGWVGIELDKNDETGVMTVTRVVPDSPAQAAGFKKGDQLVALNGARFADKDEKALKTASKEWLPGKSVTYTVARKGHERNLDVILGKPSEQVIAQWIGGHMLEHATVAQAQK